MDGAGADLIGFLARSLREAGVQLYLCKLRPSVYGLLDRAGVLEVVGRDHVFTTKDQALAAIYPKLESAKCAGCLARIFIECQVTLPDGSLRDKPRPELTLEPRGSS